MTAGVVENIHNILNILAREAFIQKNFPREVVGALARSGRFFSGWTKDVIEDLEESNVAQHFKDVWFDCADVVVVDLPL